MNKRMKKLLSLAMALAMVLSLSVTAFAVPGGGGTGGGGGGTDTPDTPTEPGATSVEASLDFETTLNAPTISVELTSNNAIIMNPYGLTFVDPVTENDSTAGMATAVNIITSTTLAPLDVDVTVTSSAPDTVTWASSAIANTSTEKEVYMQFAMQYAADDDVTAPAWAGTAGGASGSWTALTYSGTATAPAANTLAAATNKAKLITLDGTAITEGEDTYYYVMAAAADADSPVYAAFKLCGTLNQKAAEPWTAADAITASVAFTFNVMSPAQLA